MCARTTRGSPRRWQSTSNLRCSRPYASAVHLRGAVAAAAGMCAAAMAHALDATGSLLFVHETADVRSATSTAQVVVWLALAAGIGAVAASTRLLLVGVPGALLVSATPELIGPGDSGSVSEPGAILGALVQVLLLVAVVAMALALERRLSHVQPELLRCPAHLPRHLSTQPVVHLMVDGIPAPRAPPRCVQSTT